MAYKPPGVLQLLIEGAVVGLVFAILFGIVHFIFMRFFADEAMKNHTLLVLQVALAGFVGHVLFELTRLNEVFCLMR